MKAIDVVILVGSAITCVCWWLGIITEQKAWEYLRDGFIVLCVMDAKAWAEGLVDKLRK